MKLLSYVAGRLVVYLLVIVVGLTILFFVPRFAPTDPIWPTASVLAVR
jgi:peptide/nickel transport system permease protein